MRTLIFIFMLLFAGCSKDCPECYNFAEPFRLAILNEQNDNLLDPNNPDKLVIDKLTLASREIMDFEIKNYIIPAEPSGFYHLQSIDEDYFDSCIDKEGEFYITYKNSSDIDTINVLIEKETTKNKDGCICTGHPYRYIKHNGEIVTEYDGEPNNTGAAIIRK